MDECNVTEEEERCFGDVVDVQLEGEGRVHDDTEVLCLSDHQCRLRRCGWCGGEILG